MPASCTHQQRNDSQKKRVATAAFISEGTGRADCGKNNCDRPSEIIQSLQMSCFPAHWCRYALEGHRAMLDCPCHGTSRRRDRPGRPAMEPLEAEGAEAVRERM
jgi:hypothetical protein